MPNMGTADITSLEILCLQARESHTHPHTFTNNLISTKMEKEKGIVPTYFQPTQTLKHYEAHNNSSCVLDT